MPSLTGNDLSIQITTSADVKGIEETQAAISGLESAQTVGSRSSVNWSSELTKAGAIAGGITGVMGLLTKNALDQASSYQQNRVAFETMLGSADKAKTLLKQVSDFAAQTPFQLPDVVAGSKNLLAFGVSMDQIIPTFTNLGNIAAGVGTDKLPALINVFGQVKAAGRLMSQDLLQFTSAGVPVIDLLAQHFGIASNQVKTLVENGKVTFDDLNSSLQLLGGPTGKWGDLMAKQSKTFNGTLSNVQDNLGRILRQAVGIGPDGDIRKGSLFDVATKGATALMNWLGRIQPQLDKLVGFFEHNKTAVIALAGAMGGLLIGVLAAVVVAIGWIPFAIVAAGMLIGAVIATIISKWQEWHTWILLIGAVITAPLMPFIGMAILIIKYWDDIKNFAMAAINFIVSGVMWLKDNWIQAIGFVIGFFATLPFKLPVYIYDAFARIIGFLMGINWGGVFSSMGRAIEGVAGWIWNSISSVWQRITSLNWGQITIGIGKQLGNALIDLIQGALNGALHGIPGHPHVNLPHFAKGVRNFSGGLAVVGENGPELLNLPAGSDVFSNNDSKRMVGASAQVNHYHYGDVYLGDRTAVAAWFEETDRDNLLINKGLSPARGMS